MADNAADHHLHAALTLVLSFNHNKFKNVNNFLIKKLLMTNGNCRWSVVSLACVPYRCTSCKTLASTFQSLILKLAGTQTIVALGPGSRNISRATSIECADHTSAEGVGLMTKLGVRRSGLMIALGIATLAGTEISAIPRLKDIVDCFAGRSTKYRIDELAGPVRTIEANEQDSSYTYYGISVDEVDDVNYHHFKDILRARIGCPSASIVHVAGDYEAFGRMGAMFGRSFFSECVIDDHVVAYECTGRGADVDEPGAEGLINGVLDERPERSRNVVAIVDGRRMNDLDTIGWCMSPYVRHFLVLYKNHEGRADYSPSEQRRVRVPVRSATPDCAASTDIVTSLCDSVTCFEGDAKAFLKIVKALGASHRVNAVLGLRDSSRAAAFSASRLVDIFSARHHRRQQRIENGEAQELCRTYATAASVLLSPARNEEVFAQASKLFVDNGIFAIVDDLCTFHDASQEAA